MKSETSRVNNLHIIPWVIAVALFMENLDVTIISTAIPSIAADFQVDPVSMKLAITSYLLSLSLFIPISGWIADKFGNRTVLSCAMLVFAIGSLACSLSHSLTSMVIARIIQGTGGALSMPVGRLILIRSFPRSELIKANNFVTIPALLGPTLGPVLGGVITHYISWNWIFYINIPISFVGIYLTLRYIDNYKNININPFDFVGFLLFGCALALFSFGFEALGGGVLSNTHILILILFGAILFIAYFFHEKKIPFPIIDLNLFKVRTFKLTQVGSFLSRIGVGSMPFLLPLLLQLGYGLTPLHAGFLLLPLTFGMFVMKLLVRRTLKRFGFKRVMIINTALLFLSFLQFAFVTVNTPFWLLAVMIFFNGFFSSMQFTCVNTLSFVDIENKIMGMGTSIASTVQQLSTSFGVSISAILLGWSVSISNLTNQPVYHLNNFRLAFIGISVISLSALLFINKLRQTDGKIISGYPARKL